MSLARLLEHELPESAREQRADRSESRQEPGPYNWHVATGFSLIALSATLVVGLIVWLVV